MRSTRFRRLFGVAMLAMLAGFAAFPALAQFSAPYDSDFAPAPVEKKEAPAAAPAEPSAPTEPAVPGEPEGAAPFQLLDRPSGAGFLTPAPAASTESARAPRDPGEVRAGMTPVQYDAERFVRVREQVDRGEEPGEERTGPDGGPLLVNEDIFLSTNAPKPPPPEVELPTYGTSLSVTGRKVITFNFSEKRFLNTQKTTGRVQTTNLIEIDQQLQLRMQGKVGPKITVNVDYDDTKLNQQDISVVYQGDPSEIVQNVSFGDIDLSLPATEFVSYNKQLFGIRGDVKYKGFRSTFIGSRTKGTTKTKQFTGNTQFVAIDLTDTSYLRRQYYDATYGNSARLPIKSGSERVFLAKQEIGVANLNEQTLTVDDIVDTPPGGPIQSSTFTGRFLPLVAGQDYTIDYAKGIIQFRNQLLPQYAVAIDYLTENGNIPLATQISSHTLDAGGSGLFKLIKTPNDVPIAEAGGSSRPQAGFDRELKTFYSIGQNQIVRDNGRGNFFLRVLDLNRNEVGPGLLPQQKYPDTIEVDFENGLFRLKQPFSVGNSSPTTLDPDVYAQTPISKRLFRIEYNFRFRTFFLEPNLVVQSEIVILDGQRLTRNVDFFIDYEAGFITFFNPDRIGPSSTIDMTFEVAPFANLNNDTLLGTRVSHEWGPDAKYSLGSTILYQAGSKSPTVPQITELAKSLLVYEFDAQAKRIKIGNKLIMTLAGEFAQSRQNLNLNPFALIDNMEGIKQEEQAPTLAAQWQIASNPGVAAAAPNKLNWISEDVNILDINPRAQANASESQKVLQFQYGNGGANPLADGDVVSIVYPFNVAGVDMSQKTVLEVVMLGDNSGNELNFRLGGIDENADGLGVLRTEDTNNDGILQPGEDVGFLYGVAPTARYGAGNGIIDTFDLDKNGFLNPDDFNGANYGYFCTGGANCDFNDVTTTPTNRPGGIINFAGPTWHTLQIPLNISTATLSRFTNIKHLRLSIRKRAGSLAASGTLKFARIAVVGNSWQRGVAGDPAVPGSGAIGTEALTVTPVNSVDNPTYTPIFNAAGDAAQVFNDLYGSLSALQRLSNTKNLSEQALQLQYANLAAGTTVYTKRVFSRAIDISQHKDFNFLVFGNAATPIDVTGNQVFFMRAGSDQDYFEVRVPITFNGWKKIRVKQTDRNKDSVMDDWTADIPGTVIVSSGNPSLQQVGQLVAGIYNTGGPAASGSIFLNEIHVAEPVTRVGTAKKIQADFETPGWGTFGLKHRSIDRNFQTPTSVVANQDKIEDSSYLNLTRLAWFPMSFNINRFITDTPSTVQTGDLSNLVNLLQQGKVTTWVGSAQGNIAYGAYPRLSLSHTRNRVEYDLLTRLDDRQTYNGTMQYGVPSQSRFLPRTIDANAGHIRYDVSFENPLVKRAVGNFDTAERTNSYGTRLTFTPWNGSSFNPTWSMTKVTESRVDSTGVAPISTRYPKSFSQSAGFASNYRLTSWLNPQVNYQIDTIENNILAVSTFVVAASTFVFQPGDIKTVNRSANASISLPIQISDIFPRTKLFRSVNIISGYQMQDGDVWNQVEKGLSTQQALWIRTPLRPTNPAAQRVNLTLRDTYNSTQRWTPLDGYDLRGRKAALRTISLSNNYVLSVQRNEATGTPSKTVSRTLPDAVASISQLEQLWFSEKWMANAQMNFRYSKRTTENVGSTLQTEDSFGTDLRTIVVKRYETLISYNQRKSDNKDLRIDANTQKTKHQDITTQVTFDIRKFRITPKVDYAKDTAQLGTGIKTQDVEVITPSILVRADLALPAGLRLPGSAKPLLFTNRIIWTTTASLAQRRSPVTVADNSKLFSFNTSGDYEIAKNLRMTLNGSAQRLWHRFLKEEDFVAYAFGTTLTFQF